MDQAERARQEHLARERALEKQRKWDNFAHEQNRQAAEQRRRNQEHQIHHHEPPGRTSVIGPIILIALVGVPFAAGIAQGITADINWLPAIEGYPGWFQYLIGAVALALLVGFAAIIGLVIQGVLKVVQVVLALSLALGVIALIGLVGYQALADSISWIPPLEFWGQ